MPTEAPEPKEYGKKNGWMNGNNSNVHKNKWKGNQRKSEKDERWEM